MGTNAAGNPYMSEMQITLLGRSQEVQKERGEMSWRAEKGKPRPSTGEMLTEAHCRGPGRWVVSPRSAGIFLYHGGHSKARGNGKGTSTAGKRRLIPLASIPCQPGLAGFKIPLASPKDKGGIHESHIHSIMGIER